MNILLPSINKYAGYLLLVWGVISFTATHTPLPDTDAGLPYVDKIIHIVIYMILSFLFSMWWNKKKSIDRKNILIIFSILIIYACLDEYLQSFVGRTPDIKDIVADAIGIFIGILLALCLRNPFYRNTP